MTAASAPTAGWFEGREHVLPVRVYYEDTDFTGLVYHANYLRFFERARSDFLRLAGVSHAELFAQEDQTAFAITRMEIDFRSPARIDDALLVRTTYDSIRGPRLSIRQRVLRGEALLAEAAVGAACIGAGGRARKPPRGVVAALTPWLVPIEGAGP